MLPPPVACRRAVHSQIPFIAWRPSQAGKGPPPPPLKSEEEEEEEEEELRVRARPSCKAGEVTEARAPPQEAHALVAGGGGGMTMTGASHALRDHVEVLMTEAAFKATANGDIEMVRQAFAFGARPYKVRRRG